MTMLSASKRNATVVAERDSKLWKLDQQGLEKLEKERPEIARRFVKIVLKGKSGVVEAFGGMLT